MRSGFLLVVLVFSLSAQAEYNLQIAQFLDREITAVEKAVNQTPPGNGETPVSGLPAAMVMDATPAIRENPPPSPEGDETWFFQNFWIRIRARGGIAIPDVFRLEIIPEVELLWQRPRPEGWEFYKP